MVRQHTSDENQDYPQELLDAHQIEDGVAHYPIEDVLIGLECHLYKKGVFYNHDPEAIPDSDRWLTIGDYIRSYSQEELYQELQEQDSPVITSGSKHLDPEWKPRTESTYELLQYLTSTSPHEPSEI